MERRERYARTICKAFGQNPDAIWPPTPVEGDTTANRMWTHHLRTADEVIKIADEEIKKAAARK